MNIQVKPEHAVQALTNVINSRHGHFVDIQTEAVKLAQKEADPHAELRALYEQQKKDGVTHLYRWEAMTPLSEVYLQLFAEPHFFKHQKYRCTLIGVKVQKQGAPEQLMTVEQATELMGKTWDVYEWNCKNSVILGRAASCGQSYTYKLRDSAVLVDGEYMSTKQAQKLAEEKKATHLAVYKTQWDAPLVDEVDNLSFTDSHNEACYYFIEKPKTKKVVQWKDIPVGVVFDIETGGRYCKRAYLGKSYLSDFGRFSYLDEGGLSQLDSVANKLVKNFSKEQPWLVGENITHNSFEGLILEINPSYNNIVAFKVKGLKEGYILEGQED